MFRILTLLYNDKLIPIISPTEKEGWLGVGLAPLPTPLKLCCYRNSSDTSTNSTRSGRRLAFLAKVYDGLQGEVE